MTNIRNFIELNKKQLQLDLEAIRLAMTHSGAKGAEAENAVRELLTKYLPKKYKFGTGFVKYKKKISPQLDIIIYDALINTPIYQGINNSTYAAGSVYGVVEVTLAKLNKSKLEQDIIKLSELRKITGEKIKFIKISAKKDKTKKGYVVHEETISSGPPPRTYIIALSGTYYKSINSLSKDVVKFTKKHGAHIHGLLVLDDINSHRKKSGKAWLIKTIAFRDYATKQTTVDAFYKLIKSMKNNFMSMLVGRYPAAD